MRTWASPTPTSSATSSRVSISPTSSPASDPLRSPHARPRRLLPDSRRTPALPRWPTSPSPTANASSHELETVDESADALIVDTGAGIGRNVLSFTSTADHVVIVTTPEPTAIADAYAVL